MKRVVMKIRSSFFVVIGLFAIQVAGATTVSQVINNLRNQNFSQQTLDSIENLLDRFVDHDDRFNGDIAVRFSDIKRLKNTLVAMLNQSSSDEYSAAIRCVQQVLGVEKKVCNGSVPMVVTTQRERDLCRKKMLDFLRLFFPHMGNQKSLYLLQKFLDEIRCRNKSQTISPKKETLALLQNFAHENINYSELTDDIVGEVTHTHTIQLKKDYYACVIKKASAFALEDYPLCCANDHLKFIVHKFIMKCVIADFYGKNFSNDFWWDEPHYKTIGCFDVFIAYLFMFSPKTLIEMYQFHPYYNSTVEIVDARKALDYFKLVLAQQVLTRGSSDYLQKFNKDLSKKVYLIEDYDGCWFGGNTEYDAYNSPQRYQDGGCWTYCCNIGKWEFKDKSGRTRYEVKPDWYIYDPIGIFMTLGN